MPDSEVTYGLFSMIREETKKLTAVFDDYRPYFHYLKHMYMAQVQRGLDNLHFDDP